MTDVKQIAPADYDTPLDDMEHRFLPAVKGSKTTAWWNMEHEEWGPYAELAWVIVEHGDVRIWIRPLELTPEDREQVQAAIDQDLEDMG